MMIETDPKLFDVGDPKLVPAIIEEPPAPLVDIGKLSPPIPYPPFAGATLSDDRVFRYALWRRVLEKGPVIMYVGTNPSKADEENDDPTVKRYIQFTKDWGYSMFLAGNLYGFRATDPDDLKFAMDRVGPDNDHHLVEMRKAASLCVVAWGNHCTLDRRGEKVLELLRPLGPLHCLRKNKNGTPGHVLYLSSKLKPVEF